MYMVISGIACESYTSNSNYTPMVIWNISRSTFLYKKNSVNIVVLLNINNNLN